ncbi:hypothetical protein [Pseudomonas aeruginosa]|uniref:hypothetical protein n=1 Tax=Pseudomonas aeruginosa TaxID=287 RepID=UPI0024BFDE41|nr:hypothetical protein [Pseudomonas aeruginosa]WHV47846.1 hypothetical protein M2I87_15210 [Pseudomonas aeruginosa]
MARQTVDGQRKNAHQTHRRSHLAQGGKRDRVKAVIHLQASVKDTEVLRWLILKGLEEITPEDLERFHKKRD